MRDMKGYYDKFIVTRRDTGEEVTGFKFTLLPDHDEHAAAALRAYADLCETDNPGLAADLRAELEKLA